MSYTVSIQEKQDYLRVEVTGERKRGQEANDAKEFWLHMANLCENKGIFRILAIFNLTGTVSDMAAGYELGKWIAENKSLGKIRTAVVDLNDESRRDNVFLETVAGNRSSYDIGKVFADEEKAIEWLLKSLR